ncbi:HAD family hydrolase [Tanticharoenia sakaeratensis]|uniref:phosphoglycolate phosphatase n=1 Tax=Tanticharoenia sakaeratensis NBRC 103193 TaxID=1231623 RepID=A0A0D6MPZ1_9PROT|nr:HAD family phosphatase [Tanticharoenia sakaeratensis]GAN55358.1 phosphatase [Tanticharoenia sakaeratensis NBRC 103193]GBQ16607.1 phosphatase [Tanticharoenia sakaeratensis NBRC 103193]
MNALDPNGQLRMVIFDCDGVLIDSEGPSCLMVADVARSYGMDVPDAEAVPRFAGKALDTVRREIERATGRVLPDDFLAVMQARLVTLMEAQAEPIDGVERMLDGIVALGLPFRVGSNSSIPEMVAKFARTGLSGYFEDNVHSARDMGHPKPSPAVYLHAAAVEGITPEDCVVIEDSDTGARAAEAAGMACVMLRHGASPLPDLQGLVRIEHLDELVPLLRDTLERQRAARV